MQSNTRCCATQFSYLWPTSGHHILLGILNNHIDDGDRDEDEDDNDNYDDDDDADDSDDDNDDDFEVEHWCLSLMTVLRLHPRELTHTAANDVLDNDDDDDDDANSNHYDDANCQ